MKPLTIVKELNIFKQYMTGMVFVNKISMVDQFRLQRFDRVQTRILFFPSFPDGCMFTLLDLKGRLIYRSFVKGASLELPALITGNIALWHVKNRRITACGMIALK